MALFYQRFVAALGKMPIARLTSVMLFGAKERKHAGRPWFFLVFPMPAMAVIRSADYSPNESGIHQPFTHLYVPRFA
jgi:hypothetical protein